MVSGGAGPGTARVDRYTFFAEVSTAGGQTLEGVDQVTGEKLLFEIKSGQASLTSLWGQCVEFNGKNIAYLEGGADVLRNVVTTSTGGSTVPAEFFIFEMASILQERPEFDHADLAAGVQVAHFIDSHIRVKIEAAATVSRGSPTLCTFSGTVDVIRAR